MDYRVVKHEVADVHFKMDVLIVFCAGIRADS